MVANSAEPVCSSAQRERESSREYFERNLFIIYVYRAMSNKPGGHAYSYSWSEKYSTACHTRGTGATGPTPTTHTETKILWAHHFYEYLYLCIKAESNPRKWRNIHTQIYTHTHTLALICSLRSTRYYSNTYRIQSFLVLYSYRSNMSKVALSCVCARVLLCRPICVGSKVVPGPGRGYRWADENSRGSV